MIIIVDSSNSSSFFASGLLSRILSTTIFLHLLTPITLREHSIVTHSSSLSAFSCRIFPCMSKALFSSRFSFFSIYFQPLHSANMESKKIVFYFSNFYISLKRGINDKLFEENNNFNFDYYIIRKYMLVKKLFLFLEF